jgi:molybdate transport system substrate-binding protein
MQSLHEFMRDLNSLHAHPTGVRRRHWLCTALLTPVASHSAPPLHTSIRVLAASDLKFALAHTASYYQKQTGVSVDVQLGSSGNLSRQIAQGLPGDILMSADQAYPAALVASGHAQGPSVAYGLGRIALLLPAERAGSTKDTGQTLTAAAARDAASLPVLVGHLRPLLAKPHKFAIANPDHAPYGRAAREALQALNLWDTAQAHLVLGENIAQATQFVTTGAATAGITAWPLALPLLQATTTALRTAPASPTLQALLLPSQLHQPLRQHMVLLKNASPRAESFFKFLQSPTAREILRGFGFEAASHLEHK